MKRIQFIALLGIVGLSSFTSALLPHYAPASVVEMNEQKEAEWNKVYQKLEKNNWNSDVLTTKEAELGIWEASAGYWMTYGADGGDSWYNDGGPESVTASSSLKNQGKYAYDAKNAHDFNLKTIWAEGVKGQGIGEYLLYKFRKNAPRITTIYVANGCIQSKALYEANSRVKKLKVYYNNEPIAILDLQDVRGVQAFQLDSPIGCEPYKDNSKEWTMKFEIMEVYPGTKYDDTVISEIYFNGIDVL